MIDWRIDCRRNTRGGNGAVDRQGAARKKVQKLIKKEGM